MKHKKPPVPVIVLVVVALVLGGYYGIQSLTTNGAQTLLVSGTIEATEITISPEMAGKVADVFVNEGASVKKGDPLFRLDDSLLQGQRNVALAALDTARAAGDTARAALETARLNFNLALNAARLEAAAIRTQDWTSAAYLGSTQQEQLVAAGDEVAAAKTSLDLAIKDLNANLASPDAQDFVKAERNLLSALSAERTAQDVLDRSILAANPVLMDLAQSALDSTKDLTGSAQEAYDNLKQGEPAQRVISARMELAIAQECYEAAQDRWLKLQIGEASPKVQAARAVLDQADTASIQAEKAISQAEAQLALIDLQIDKLEVLSPSNGVVLTRAIQPGEMVNAVATAFKIGLLDELTITVYVPEDIYGTLMLGQNAALAVDSYPDETFSASIIHIADQAEFTPRNVQTVEGRKATVFAIRLTADNSSGKLKPGMPADIIFEP